MLDSKGLMDWAKASPTKGVFRFGDNGHRAAELIHRLPIVCCKIPILFGVSVVLVKGLKFVLAGKRLAGIRRRKDLLSSISVRRVSIRSPIAGPDRISSGALQNGFHGHSSESSHRS